MSLTLLLELQTFRRLFILGPPVLGKQQSLGPPPALSALGNRLPIPTRSFLPTRNRLLPNAGTETALLRIAFESDPNEPERPRLKVRVLPFIVATLRLRSLPVQERTGSVDTAIANSEVIVPTKQPRSCTAPLTLIPLRHSRR